MNGLNSNIKYDFLKSVCELAVQDYDSQEFVTIGQSILDDIENEKPLILAHKSKNVLGSFLANWYNKNKVKLAEIQNKMYKVNYDSSKLVNEQNVLLELNVFLDLVKEYNRVFYDQFFIGTNKVEYRKNIRRSLILAC